MSLTAHEIPSLTKKKNKMPTVFSHIVQKRLSQESENVATTALEFIFDSSKAARNGMIKLLRGVESQIPSLWFRTQQSEDNSRPDMWGYDDAGAPHVFIENKFWAGLTEQQPVSYLRILAKQSHPTLLLIVAPDTREQALVRELRRKLTEAEISSEQLERGNGIALCLKTDIGPILALTSWTKLLSFIELEVADDRTAKGDLLQLRSLCEEADSAAFLPVSSEEASNHRIPALILQLSSIWQSSVDLAVTEGVLNLKGTTPQASSERIGRYAYIGTAGAWLGIHFGLWKKHGGTPLWVVFSAVGGRAHEVRQHLEPWAAQKDVFSVSEGGSFAVALNIKFGETKERVVGGIVNRLKEIADVLSVMKAKPNAERPLEVE